MSAPDGDQPRETGGEVITYPKGAEHILIRRNGPDFRATVQIGEYGTPEYRVAKRDGWSPAHALRNAVAAIEIESPMTFTVEDWS